MSLAPSAASAALLFAASGFARTVLFERFAGKRLVRSQTFSGRSRLELLARISWFLSLELSLAQPKAILALPRQRMAAL
eukprot:6138502-Pyramimonas_sp.AAC.1